MRKMSSTNGRRISALAAAFTALALPALAHATVVWTAGMEKGDLSEWTRSLSTVDKAADTTERLPASGVDSTDSYAPARAYATDTVDAPATPTTATGRASVKDPLWPERPDPAPGKPSPKGKGKR